MIWINLLCMLKISQNFKYFFKKMVCTLCSFFHNATFIAFSKFQAMCLVQESSYIVKICKTIYSDNAHHLKT
jgi:hypothetical protein